jgi:hypothetical protein
MNEDPKAYLSNSWVIVDRKTNKGVWEFYSESIIQKINTEKYYVLRSDDYLSMVNKRIREGSTEYNA